MKIGKGTFMYIHSTYSYVHTRERCQSLNKYRLSEFAYDTTNFSLCFINIHRVRVHLNLYSKCNTNSLQETGSVHVVAFLTCISVRKRVCNVHLLYRLKLI